MITPLWLLYEGLALRVNHGFAGDYRTGLDYLLKTGFLRLHIPPVFAVVLPFGLLLLIAISGFRRWRRSLHFKPVFAAMLVLESLVYAVGLGLLASVLVDFFLSAGVFRINPAAVHTLVIHLGSGVYEEFLFRFLLLTGLSRALFRGLAVNAVISGLVAVLVSSLAFALFHFMSVFHESFQFNAFWFRFFSGLLFSGIYLFRGLGVAVYSHSFFNIFLMFR